MQSSDPAADALKLALPQLGWAQTASLHPERAAVLWDTKLAPEDEPDYGAVAPGQTVSRLPGIGSLCRKAVFAKLYVRTARLFGELDGYVPRQWALPAQAAELGEHATAAAARARTAGRAPPTYIVKPDSGSQGDGITLTREPCRPGAYAERERVVQEYLERPLLLDGLKFDLRVYVVVLSVSPLRAFLYREALARFAVRPYAAPSAENLRHVNAHLTNYSLNKHDAGFRANVDAADGGADGSKRTASAVLAALHAAGRLAAP